MKKMTMIVILIGMFVWALYDFVEPVSDANFAGNDNYTIENGAAVAVDGTETLNVTAEGVEVGDVASDFELTTLDGDTVKLSDFRGERVMLNFWATWCPPCRAEMPDMQKFHEEKDIVILAVNLTDTETNSKHVPDFVEEYGLTFPVLMDEHSKVSDLYRIKPIPTSYMIDSKGLIQYKAFGALNYELMIQEFEKMK
ncbi:redoxin domain-containing protein [Virgibacillus sp. C22-A2]|uniref:Redoxin domain-containing protein n=1 Tax=Virgibacillus tibetensis TaxID=3042313 RepID=A0ABU6KID7_9BACI|nr:redoxin domain-containing protein [Virgibacillus sp. C22-A2]